MTGERALSRRGLLRSAASASALGAAGLAGGLSGCTSTGGRAARRRTPLSAAPAGGDVALLTQSLADEQRLLAYCTAAAVRHPALAPSLAPLRKIQRRHVAVMRRTLGAPHNAPATPRPASPAGSAAVRARLVVLVRRAQRRRSADCLVAESGLLARLLASVAASHAVTLDQLGARP